MTVWLQDVLGLDPLLARGLQLVVAFLFVVAAIFLVFALLRRRARGRTDGPRSAQRRLGLVEAINVDDTRRLVLVRRDGVEHLLLIGGPSDVVVEASITRTAARPSATAAPRPAAAVEPPPAAPPPVAVPEPSPAPVAAPATAAVEPPAPPVVAAPPRPVAPPPDPSPLRLAAERPPVPAPRPAASLDVRPVRPSAPAVEPATSPRPPVREAPVPRLDPDPAAKSSDGVIRPERR